LSPLPETDSLPSARWFAECNFLALDKEAFCRVPKKTLGKANKLFAKCFFWHSAKVFAECFFWHSAKKVFAEYFWFYIRQTRSTKAHFEAVN
jgi:hypothetical protein